MLPLHTERLVLRLMLPTDADIVVAYRNDPEIAAMQDWDLPYSLERARTMLARQADRDDLVAGDWTSLALQLNRDLNGDLIGDVACRIDDTCSVAEIGYTLRREFHGHGYAREAVAALVDHVLASTPVHRIEASLDPQNVASMRVLESIGFTFETFTRQSYFMRGEWYDDLRYAMLRDDRAAWLARPATPPSTVELVEITPDDAYLWGRLATHHSQQRFVATMALSFRDALFPEVVDGAPVVPWMRGVIADGQRVGFVMLAEVTAHHHEPFLWRLLIDRWHQRRGIGERVIGLVVERLRAEGQPALVTSWVGGLPGTPEPFYWHLGFAPTGEMDGAETVGRLSW
jgi:RimJ/RimL family protein N-acetyltransferase